MAQYGFPGTLDSFLSEAIVDHVFSSSPLLSLLGKAPTYPVDYVEPEPEKRYVVAHVPAFCVRVESRYERTDLEDTSFWIIVTLPDGRELEWSVTGGNGGSYGASLDLELP